MKDRTGTPAALGRRAQISAQKWRKHKATLKTRKRNVGDQGLRDLGWDRQVEALSLKA